MCVIRGAARFQNGYLVIPSNCSQIAPQLVAQFIRNSVPTLFGTEHAMHQDVWIRMRHDSPVPPELLLTDSSSRRPQHYRAGLSYSVPDGTELSLTHFDDISVRLA